MIQQRFTIFDSKAEAYITPFYSQTVGTAVRSFEQVCNDVASDFHKFAADYTLFHIGAFDNATGLDTNLDAHVNLGVALSYIKESS